MTSTIHTGDALATPSRIEVLNLGGGVQSTALALMSIHGELPRLNYAIFADTGWEPAAVYRHLDWLQPLMEAVGVSVIRVKAKGAGILADHDAFLQGKAGRVETMPLRIVAENGTPGAPILRKCTRHYKHRPIERAMTVIKRRHKGAEIRRWLGISYDEQERMTVGFWHPLIEERTMSRSDCVAWMAARGYSAPRSACIGCPYHDNTEWRKLRDEAPAEFQEAVEFDRRLRSSPVATFDGIRAPVYLHKDCVPLDQANLAAVENRQQSFIECSGGCFL